MKEKPILFSAPMVRAILDGRKTQTRRVMKFKNGGVQPRHNDFPGMRQIMRNCPFGQPGDRLWVREAFSIVPRTAYRCSEGVQQVLRPDDDHDAAIYREGWVRSQSGFRWRPSIHMPRWASRITLEVTAIRIERLQDISDQDCWAEGIEPMPDTHGWLARAAEYPREAFADLWVETSGDGSWEVNPWVWVIEFRRI